jgi:hypothetical protein
VETGVKKKKKKKKGKGKRADLRWLYKRCCWRLLTGEWLGW